MAPLLQSSLFLLFSMGVARAQNFTNTTTTNTTTTTTPSSGSTGACLLTIAAIATADAYLMDDELVTVRSYTLCGNTNSTMGVLDYNYQVKDGQTMLPLRPNLAVTCATTNCVLHGGDLQVDGTNDYGVTESPLTNVLLQGLTFEAPLGSFVKISKPGNVTFRNCEFRSSTQAKSTPVLLDYFDPGNVNDQLVVTFDNCTFSNNVYRGRPARPAIVVGNSRQNRLIFEGCQFFNNDMNNNNTLATSNAYLVESSGPITVLRSCFAVNEASAGMLGIYNTEHNLVDNFEDISRGARCTLASVYETVTQWDAGVPTCVDYDATTCLAGGTTTATVAPQGTPTTPPSGRPSIAPASAVAPVNISSTPTPVAAPTTSAPVVNPTGGDDGGGVTAPTDAPVTTAAPRAAPAVSQADNPDTSQVVNSRASRWVMTPPLLATTCLALLALMQA